MAVAIPHQSGYRGEPWADLESPCMGSTTHASRLHSGGRAASTALLPALCLVAAAAAAVTPARGQAKQPSEAERMRRMAELVNKPVVYTVPGMDRVKVRKDIVYKKTDDPNMKMDVYTPPGLGPGEQRPAVILLHGGAPTRFQPKEWGFYQSWGRLVAASGMAAVTFTSRVAFPPSPPPPNGG